MEFFNETIHSIAMDADYGADRRRRGDISRSLLRRQPPGRFVAINRRGEKCELTATPEADRRGRVFTPLGCWSDRLTAGRVCRIVSAIGEAAGVKVNEKAGKVKFASAHDFRQAFGLRWSRRVMPAQLRELMRHQSIDTTMKFYVGQNAESTAATLWEAVAGNTSLNPSVSPAQDQSESPC